MDLFWLSCVYHSFNGLATVIMYFPLMIELRCFMHITHQKTKVSRINLHIYDKIEHILGFRGWINPFPSRWPCTQYRKDLKPKNVIVENKLFTPDLIIPQWGFKTKSMWWAWYFIRPIFYAWFSAINNIFLQNDDIRLSILRSRHWKRW